MNNIENILVPTDFSTASENALDYAIELAKRTGASLSLINAYRVPVPTAADQIIMTMDDLEQNSNQLLIDLDNRIKKDHPGIKTKLIAKAGMAVDVIVDEIRNGHAGLVVIGMKGHTNAFDRFIGSNTTSLMKSTKCPVLVIPGNVSFKPPETIVLACDHTRVIPPQIAATLKYFSKLFGAKINILEVFRTNEEVTYEKVVPAVLLENSLTGHNHTSHIREGDDIGEELDKYIALYKPEWLVLIPHERSMLRELFHKSFSKQMAFHTHIPLLSIHE